MPENELQRLYRETMGLRVGPEMASYIATKLQTASPAFTIIAANARTGLPLLHEIDPTTFPQTPER